MKAAPVRSETVKKLLRPALIVLAVLIVLLNSITVVQAGHTGGSGTIISLPGAN